MKKICISLFLIFTIILITGCGKESLEEKMEKEDNEEVLHCTRNVTAQDNITTDIKYSIYFYRLM